MLSEQIPTLEVIIGPMFSGKTESLIWRISKAIKASLKVDVFYPLADTRSTSSSGVNQIQSHGGMTFNAVPISSPADVLELVDAKTQVVAIDEIQFFDDSLIPITSSLLAKGIKVILAGLDRDFLGRQFDTVKKLTSQVVVTRLRSRCAKCNKPADYTQRIIEGKPAPVDSPTIMIGGSDLYEPRCKEHFSAPVDNKKDDEQAGIIDVTNQIARWADEFQAIARTGLGFELLEDDPRRIFDKERYEKILSIAAEMMALSQSKQVKMNNIPSEIYLEDWRSQVKPGQKGYITPKITVSAAVFNSKNEVLLVKKRNSQYWDFPGGWCDIGASAADNIVKEVHEETGFSVTPLQIIGLYDSQRWGFLSQTHLYSLLFYCRLDGGDLKIHQAEIDRASFYSVDEIPALLPGIKLCIRHAFDFYSGKRSQTYFDYINSLETDQ